MVANGSGPIIQRNSQKLAKGSVAKVPRWSVPSRSTSCSILPDSSSGPIGLLPPTVVNSLDCRTFRIISWSDAPNAAEETRINVKVPPEMHVPIAGKHPTLTTEMYGLSNPGSVGFDKVATALARLVPVI